MTRLITLALLAIFASPVLAEGDRDKDRGKDKDKRHKKWQKDKRVKKWRDRGKKRSNAPFLPQGGQNEHFADVAIEHAALREL